MSEISACQVPLINEMLSAQPSSSGEPGQPARGADHSSPLTQKIQDKSHIKSYHNLVLTGITTYNITQNKMQLLYIIVRRKSGILLRKKKVK